MTETQQAAVEAEMRDAGIRVITQADADATRARLEAAGVTVVTDATSTVTLLHKTTTEDAAWNSGIGK